MRFAGLSLRVELARTMEEQLSCQTSSSECSRGAERSLPFFVFLLRSHQIPLGHTQQLVGLFLLPFCFSCLGFLQVLLVALLHWYSFVGGPV